MDDCYFSHLNSLQLGTNVVDIFDRKVVEREWVTTLVRDRAVNFVTTTGFVAVVSFKRKSRWINTATLLFGSTGALGSVSAIRGWVEQAERRTSRVISMRHCWIVRWLTGSNTAALKHQSKQVQSKLAVGDTKILSALLGIDITQMVTVCDAIISQVSGASKQVVLYVVLSSWIASLASV